MKVGLFTANRAEQGLLEPVYKALSHAGIMPCWHHIVGNNWRSASNEAVVQLAEIDKDDFYIVPCDRQEMMGVALELFTTNRPFAHFHAGSKGSGIHDETYRWMITRMASIHFCTSPEEAQNIIRSGEESWRVNVVGSTAFDDVEPSFSKCPPAPFDLLLIHPDTYSMEQTHKDCLDALSLLRNKQTEPCVAVGPNRDVNWEVVDMNMTNYNRDWPFFYYYPDGLPRDEFLGLMKMCRRFITNSSSALYELPAFGGGKLFMIGKRNAGRPVVENIQPGGGKRIAEILKNLNYDKETLLRKKFS